MKRYYVAYAYECQKTRRWGFDVVTFDCPPDIADYTPRRLNDGLDAIGAKVARFKGFKREGGGLVSMYMGYGEFETWTEFDEVYKAYYAMFAELFGNRVAI